MEHVRVTRLCAPVYEAGDERGGLPGRVCDVGTGGAKLQHFVNRMVLLGVGESTV